MDRQSLDARATHLDLAGQPYVVATVVAVERPTSARPGARGIVHPDGSIEGWVGGSCAQPVVIRESLLALADGQPRLLRISADGPSDARVAGGIIELRMTCQSGGTLEIYVEPHLPAPQLWIAGITPIAAALASLGAASGYQVAVFDPAMDPARFPGVNFASSETRLDQVSPQKSPFVVVATQGQWDEEALLAALRRETRYVGLVASPRRAASVRTFLRDEGVPAERIAAIRAPAGMDLGAETAEEVALSILAELVQVRRGRAPFVAAPGPATVAGPAGAVQAATVAAQAPPADVVLVDPVCGMTVDPDHLRHTAEHEGAVYAFCCLPCRTRFVREPAAYLSKSPAPG